jgi:hypothetical protein
VVSPQTAQAVQHFVRGQPARPASCGDVVSTNAFECLLPTSILTLALNTSPRRRHTLFRQLLPGAFALGEVIKTHSVQNVRRLGELNRRIVNNLNAISPRVEEV